jgi:hypothetical protein
MAVLRSPDYTLGTNKRFRLPPDCVEFSGEAHRLDYLWGLLIQPGRDVHAHVHHSWLERGADVNLDSALRMIQCRRRDTDPRSVRIARESRRGYAPR